MADRDYSSIYNIKDFFINNIASDYFNNIEDISKMNVGLLGLISSISATTTEDVFNTMALYLNEMIPSQATLPDTIYAYATQYGINDIFSKCAIMPAVLLIKEKDVIEKGVLHTDGTITFIIDSNLVVYVEDIPFSIPYNIQIKAHKLKSIKDAEFKSGYNYICTYNNSIPNSLSDISSNPYLKIIKMVADNESFIGIKVNLYQYIKHTHHENIINNNRMNIPTIEYSFDNSLCNFEMMYQASSDSSPTQCEKLTDTSYPSKKPSCFYKLKGELNETIRFTFSTDDRYFIPEYNSDITTTLFETLGSKGNFEQYNGNNITVHPSSDTYDYNNSVNMYCVCMGASTGGSDRLSINDIKRLMLSKRITDNSYTTDNDLDTYFLNYTAIYGTSAKFIKRRDDYAGREFNCYTRMMKDEVIYPTNTLRVSIPASSDKLIHDDVSNIYTLQPGTKFIYSNDTTRDNCILLTDDVQLSKDDHVYVNPMTIQILMEPNSIGCYMTVINKNIELDYSYSNGSSPFQFVSSGFSISRNPIGEDYNKYKISFSFSLADFTGDGSNYDIDASKLAVLLYFPTLEGFIELTMEHDPESTDNNEYIYRYSGYIETNDKMINNTESTIQLTNIKDIKWVDGDSYETREILKVNPSMKVCIMYAHADTGLNNTLGIVSYSNYSLINEYTPIDNELYFSYPLNLIKPSISFSAGTDDDFMINISEIPLVAYDKFITDQDVFSFCDRLKTQHDYLNNIRNDITAGFTINMKFYNTYGRSRIFTIDNGSLLNRTNCRIAFAIKFEESIDATEYINNIKETIKTNIEKLNDIEGGYNELHSSKLITLLSTTYPQIQYIAFRSINGYDSDIQSIGMNGNIYNNPDTIPEFLTIDVDNIDIIVK